MRAYVRFGLPDGQCRELGHGDLIGRVWSAALLLPDPFVSEAHAMVSLRGGALRLLGLRGRLVVAGRQVPEALLTPGLEIELSRASTLSVIEVNLPSTALALEHPALGRKVLSGTASLLTQPTLTFVAGASRDARAILWSDGLAWYARLVGGEDRALEPGSSLEIDGHTIDVTAVAISPSGEVTHTDPSNIDAQLHLVLRYDSVHIHRKGAPTLTLDGIVARVVSDLGTAGVPISWQVLAAELWPAESDPIALRRNWDANLARLRKKLREARIRADLVRTDHRGNFELVLARGDRVDDQT